MTFWNCNVKVDLSFEACQWPTDSIFRKGPEDTFLITAMKNKMDHIVTFISISIILLLYNWKQNVKPKQNNLLITLGLEAAEIEEWYFIPEQEVGISQ